MGIAAFFLLVGCSGLRSINGSSQASPTPNPSTQAPPVEVILADGTSVTMEYHTIANLGIQMLTIAGKTEQGPTVKDFLIAAGVKDFTQATFTGLENRTLTFTPDQLTDEYIFALREHAQAVNLMSPNLPDTQWVLHVFRVEIK
jgi:hypothetical protein